MSDHSNDDLNVESIDEITWWVLDKNAYSVEMAGLTAAIVALESARSELFDAKYGMQECYFYALDAQPYCYTPSPRTALATELASMSQAEIAALEDDIDSQIEALILTRRLYAEAENTAENAARMQFHTLLGPVLAPLGIAAGADQIAEWIEDKGDEVGAIEMQQQLRQFAIDHALLINPTGMVVDVDGAHLLGTIPTARFVASSLLDLLGLDHAWGNIRIDLVGGDGTRSAVVATQDGEKIWQAPGLLGDGVPTPPITSMNDVNGRIVSMTEQAHAEGMGSFEIVRQEDSAGHVAWTVIIPGTQSWAFPPGTVPNDTTVNLQLVANERNDLTDGVALALEQLPIGPEDTVTFVGHSQGGDAAADLAANPEVGGSLNTVGLVTYGAPTGASATPAPDVNAIHMVNLEDLVPGLAGVANTNSANQVTLAILIERLDTVMEAHQGEPYADAYDLIAADSDDPAIQELQRAIAEGALWDGAVSAESYTFMFERTNLEEMEEDVLLHQGYGVR